MVDTPQPVDDSPSFKGGHLPGAAGQPAFELIQRRASPIPVVIAVPHAGRSYPDELRSRMRSPRDACLRLEDRLVDLVARDVAARTGAALLVAHAPRAMIDLNRAPEDLDWDMVAGGQPAGRPRLAAGRRARSGLGLVPRRLPGLGELWKSRMSLNDLEARIELVHRPYHSALAQVLEGLRDRWGGGLLVDMHSMPPLGAKTGASPSPEFVIGDRFGSSCAAHFSLAAIDHFEMAGRRVAHNRPYAGGYVLDRHTAPARGLHGMQIEICRGAYLDRALREPGQGLSAVIDVVTGCVRRVADELGSQRGILPQAAE